MLKNLDNDPLSNLRKLLGKALPELYGEAVLNIPVNLQETHHGFTGDTTLVVFPYTRFSKKSPEKTAEEIGEKLKQEGTYIESFTIVKGFLNIRFTSAAWTDFFNEVFPLPGFGTAEKASSGRHILVEYSSPNTNKPLHLGHIRNNLLGYSVACLLEANGHKVTKVNLVNDRGIHICKSMLAWQKWGNGETPETGNTKGDHLAGKYYVLFDKEYKKQIEELKANGLKEEEAEKQAPLIKEAQEMLRQWEAGSQEVIRVWKMMNDWVYAGFDETYRKLGVSFDKIYYESNTYLLGKEVAMEGLQKGILYKEKDGSVWIDLTSEGLDRKLILRSDGTSVYITQDLGTALLRQKEFGSDQMIYVVGNEQDYHFKVLRLILKKLGYSWAEGINHLSYGMVDLPSGKMKSREGTVVDADDLIAQMVSEAGNATRELGKIEHFAGEEAARLYHAIGMGALKFYILKVDPQKRMLFNPQESIDLNGHTGPFVQYSYARIRSVFRKAEAKGKLSGYSAPAVSEYPLQEKERDVIRLIHKFPSEVQLAGNSLSPAIIANYVYELAKTYNQFYHELSILQEEEASLVNFRLKLSEVTARIIKSSLYMLGIEAPERM